MSHQKKITIYAIIFYVCLLLLFFIGNAQAATPTPTPSPTPAKTPAPGAAAATTAPATTGTEPTEGLKLILQQPFSGLAKEIEISGTSIGEYIRALYTFATSAIVALAIVMVIVGGVRWILSAGSPEAIGKAKDTIMKSLLGLFIALFAIFMLQTLSPGTVTFKSITPEGIQGLYCCQIDTNYSQISPDQCRSQGGQVVGFEQCINPKITTATCQEDMSKTCGEAYVDAYKNNCIGKDCSSAGTDKICLQVDTTWSCVQCKKSAESCAENRDCCSGQCTDTKCVDANNAACALGNHCSTNADCNGLICATGGWNTCGYGMVGQDCKTKSDCAPGYVCNTEWFNKCTKIIQWGLCDPSNPSSCPSGYTCKEPYYCDIEANNGFSTYGCKNDVNDIVGIGSNNVDHYICVANSITCLCNCLTQSDCSTAKYDVSAPYCNGDGDDYCSPGTYGSPCDSNNQCKTSICNNYSSKNQCTQGEIGEGCSSNSECRSGLVCDDEDVCLPPSMTSCTSP